MHLLTTHDGRWNLASKCFLFGSPLMLADGRFAAATLSFALAICCTIARKWEL